MYRETSTPREKLKATTETFTELLDLTDRLIDLWDKVEIDTKLLPDGFGKTIGLIRYLTRYRV